MVFNLIYSTARIFILTLGLNFELSKIKVLRFEPNGKIHVKRMSSGKNNVYKTIDIPPAIFRKLTEEDKVKINLVETIYNMKR